MNSLTNGGIETIKVWGNMTFPHKAKPEIPKDFAASNCPLATEDRPQRSISLTNAALFKVIASIPAVKAPRFSPVTGNT